MTDDPSYRVGALVITLTVVLASLLTWSYGVALAGSARRSIPVAVLGAPTGPAAGVARRLEQLSAGGLRPRYYDPSSAADRDVDQQRIFAVFSEGDSGVVMSISSASAGSVARTLLMLTQSLPPGDIHRVVDLHPLPFRDPQGLMSFYVVLAATIAGFLAVFQLSANIPVISLRRWCGLLGGLSLLVGGALTFVSMHVLRAFGGSAVEIWTVLSIECLISAAFNLAMISLLGPWAIIPTWLLFVVFGNSASGGAVASPLLPEAFRLLNEVLPTGATVSALHTAAYFSHNQHFAPFVVLGAWLVVSVSGAAYFAHRDSADSVVPGSPRGEA